MPSTIITPTWTTATSPAVPPTRTSLPRVNSSPIEKSKRTTPISESWRTISRSATSGTGTYGPTISPASRYPSTTGWRRRWKTTVVTAATQSTTARLVRNGFACSTAAGSRLPLGRQGRRDQKRSVPECGGGCARHRAVDEADRQKLRSEVGRRRTFAIISHPDAGKTTLSEKLLLHGGAIHLAGTVKARGQARHVTSDWMELERQRGISITSSVLQFDWGGYKLNLLDTPGHQDFSEDTYRTLAAADAAVMLIDSAKGVEAQTKKLFQVCRRRGIPIFTFVNKLDRPGRQPIDLLHEVEEVLGIRTVPITWPVGQGSDFSGVAALFSELGAGARRIVPELPAVDPKLRAHVADEIELVAHAGDPFDHGRVLRGEQSPACFGSAWTEVGVDEFLAAFVKPAPPPPPRHTATGETIEPDDPRFSGFVFKIQANMDPAHRDRHAFLRVC